jgi:hypothetical protein
MLGAEPVGEPIRGQLDVVGQPGAGQRPAHGLTLATLLDVMLPAWGRKRLHQQNGANCDAN